MFVVMLVSALLITATAIVTQQFEQIFRDFKTDLPAITQVLLGFARFVLHNFGWSILPPVVIGVPFAWAAVFPPPGDPQKRRSRHGRLRLVAVVAILVFVLFVVMALFAPMISLLQTVSTPSKK